MGGGGYTAIDVVHAPESRWIFCKYLVDFCKHTNTVCWIFMTCFCLTVVFDTWSFFSFLFFSYVLHCHIACTYSTGGYFTYACMEGASFTCLNSKGACFYLFAFEHVLQCFILLFLHVIVPT